MKKLYHVSTRRSLHKPLWQLICLLTVVVLLAACAPVPAGQQAAAPAPAAPAQGAVSKAKLPQDAAPEQVLHVATGSSGSASFTFTPLQGGGDQQNWQTLVWGPPMYFDTEFKDLKPGIFVSWKPNDDFTEWTFALDPAAKWSDGSPITASDVKGTWEVMADPLTQHGRIVGYIGKVKGFAAVHEQKGTDIEGLKVVDEKTLQVTLESPDPLFHYRIATTHMNPVKAEQARKDRDNFWKPENKPAVSGPYMLESYNADAGEATMVPNPNWWKDEGPYLSKITFQFVPDAETVATMIQNKQVDATIASVPPTLKDNFPDLFRPIKAIGFNTFWLIPSVEPTDDVNVRKALILSVNFEDVLKAAFPEGGATLAKQLIDPDNPCVDTEKSWYKFDPAAAKEALKASKYGSVDKLPKLRVTPRGDWPPMNRALEAVMEMWRQNLGLTNIEFKVKPDEFGEDEKKLNLLRDDVVTRFPDAATYLWTGISSKGPISAEIMRGYNNSKVDALLTEALSTPVENPKRCQLAVEAQRIFMDDYMVIFFGIPESYISARDYVVNYNKGPDVSLIEPWKIYVKAH